MTAAAANIQRKQEAWKYKEYTLTSGKIAFKHARAALVLATSQVVPATSATGQLYIGRFAEKVDASSAAKTVTVDLEKEILIEWYKNATSTDAVAATDLGKLAYHLDDATVTITATGRSVAGRIWAVDSVKGVAIEKLENAKPELSQPAAGAFAAGDYAPATLEHEAVYDVPTTAANSTLTLPAAAQDGTCVQFAADGTKNGHTLQYRDETGPANLTTALTASKKHLVVCTKRGGKWFANAYVSP